MKNRITNRCNQFDLLAMRKQVVMWQLIDDPKQNVWRQFERCECQTHTEDRSMSIPHQSIALNSIHRFVALFDSFFRLINRKANTMRNQNLMTIFRYRFQSMCCKHLQYHDIVAMIDASASVVNYRRVGIQRQQQSNCVDALTWRRNRRSDQWSLTIDVDCIDIGAKATQRLDDIDTSKVRSLRERNITNK